MRICIFSSVADVDQKYVKAGEELARLIAKNGHTVVCGASNHGLMKRVVDVALANGASVTGVISESLIAQVDKGYEIIVEKDLAARKAQFLALSDAFAVLPGGLGTLDEMTEVLELKKHATHNKPIVILNTNGFYDGLKQQLERMESEGFLPKSLSEYLFFAQTPREAIDYLSSLYFVI